MSSPVTFDGAPPAGTINLGIGQPSADLLPVSLFARASDGFFSEAQPHEFNYGSKEGDPRFLESLAHFLTRHYASPVAAEELFLTGGNSQALDMISSIFARPGDTVFVEEPSYFLAFQVFKDHGLNVVGIPMDDDGLRIDALNEALQSHKPAFIYTIPSFHNPGGQSLSLERRAQLVELSRQHDFIIVADEVYQLLYYGEPPPRAMGTFADSGTVLSLGSFSKILAPGLRLGWIQAGGALREKLCNNGFINSGGSINHISSHIVRLALDLELQDQHLATLRQALGERVCAMDDALRQWFGDIARWTCPTGGYFFWLSLPESLDTTPIRAQALRNEVGFQPGAVFSEAGGLTNFMRLSFAHYGTADIKLAIQRLRPLFDQAGK